MMTKTEAKREFSLYFRDLKAAGKDEGYVPSRDAEWEHFLRVKIYDKQLPDEAIAWKL